MSIIKGDIKRALGYGSIKIGELSVDLSKTTAKDLIGFQEMPIKATKGKKPDDLTTDDLLAAGSFSTQWFVDYFISKDTDLVGCGDKELKEATEEIEHFVIKHKAQLQKEFTIGFGIKTRESYEKDENEAREKLEKKD